MKNLPKAQNWRQHTQNRTVLCWAASMPVCFCVRSVKDSVSLHNPLNSTILRQAKPFTRKASISRQFAQKTNAWKGKGPDTFLPLQAKQEMKRQRENREGGGRHTVEIEPLDYFVLLPTEPVWNSALSEDRNGKNLASIC